MSLVIATRGHLEIIPCRCYVNRQTGQTASLYGAHPGPGFEVVERGFTWRDTRRGTVGLCRKPATTIAEAIAIAERVVAL